MLYRSVRAAGAAEAHVVTANRDGSTRAAILAGERLPRCLHCRYNFELLMLFQCGSPFAPVFSDRHMKAASVNSTVCVV